MDKLKSFVGHSDFVGFDDTVVRFQALLLRVREVRDKVVGESGKGEDEEDVGMIKFHK